MSWKPLLEGDLAAAALQAVRDIAAAIAVDDKAPAADRTIFWAYAAPVLEAPYANTAYDIALDDLIALIQSGVPHTSLYDSGLAGLGWTLTHILDGEESLEILDEALVELLRKDRCTGGYDLAQGTTGIGVYFLERLQTGGGDTAREGLELVVDSLARSAHVTEHGITWMTSPEIAPSYREAYPDGFYDCGLAHGTPGVIAFLGRVAALEDKPVAPRKLCEAAVNWIAAHRQDRDPCGRFPAMFAKGQKTPERARAAWCYGDPGVAVALWGGPASRLGSSTSLALETAYDCATRDPQTCGARDASICHGTTGIAHLCNRFYQASGDTTFRDAARDWFVRTLALKRPANDGVGGFVQWRAEQEWQPETGLIDGAIGIGLSLISAISETEPSWDRMLLCDVPVTAKGA